MGAALDVVIGLTLVFLLASLICTVVNELIASVIKLRARELRRGLAAILDDTNLREAFMRSRLTGMAGRASSSTGPSYLSSSTFVLALFDALDHKESATAKRTIDDIRGAIDKLPESDIKSTLSELVRDAGDSLDAARAAIASWFDQMMDRLSGVYKRYLQSLSLLVAVLLCVALNIDSLEIGKALWLDEALRQGLVDRAGGLVRDVSNVDELADLVAINRDVRPLPIGWDFSAPAWSGDWYRSFSGWLAKILGIAISALAVSLGAPFWFDLLNRFVRLRGAGKEPAPVRAEPAASGVPAENSGG
jgi:hypothetical protein